MGLGGKIIADRKINFFEIVLLLVGLSVGIIGFIMINTQYQADHRVTWDLLQSVFLWLLLIVILILAATMEDVKESLAILLKENKEEIQLLREINKRHYEETKLLRRELGKGK